MDRIRDNLPFVVSDENSARGDKTGQTVCCNMTPIIGEPKG